jgi:hypothetical protein
MKFEPNCYIGIAVGLNTIAPILFFVTLARDLCFYIFDSIVTQNNTLLFYPLVHIIRYIVKYFYGSGEP